MKLVGVPLYLASLTPGRCDLAPSAIRSALRQFSTFDLEHSVQLEQRCIEDFGDLGVSDLKPEEAFETIANSIRSYGRNSGVVLVLGGDNSVTRPLVHGVTDSLNETGLITLDAHLDVRRADLGLTNGNVIRVLLNDGVPGRNIVQIGLQPFSNSASYARFARGHDIRGITVSEVWQRGIESVIREALESLSHTRCIVVDFDLDVLDRSFMPGAPGARPGGLSPRELFDAAYLLGKHPLVQAADFVELDPTKDVADVSVMNAAKCLLSFLSGISSR
ncbi:MAG: agmatinase family protein [Nitrospira sp.]|nr:agmatinase family protein [Nitrospira sp.]